MVATPWLGEIASREMGAGAGGPQFWPFPRDELQRLCGAKTSGAKYVEEQLHVLLETGKKAKERALATKNHKLFLEISLDYN
jgi:hypothetical protein